jgi:hypothetical protein
LSVVLDVAFSYLEAFDRDKVEKMLLTYPHSLSIHKTGTPEKHYTKFHLKGLQFANISGTMLATDMNILPHEHLSFVQKNKKIAYFDLSFNSIIVQELLICRHRKIPQTDFQLDVQNYRLTVLETGEIFYVGEYVMDLNFRVVICAPVSLPVVTSESTLTGLLESLRTGLNSVSTTCLAVLFVIYLLIPKLRTLPGLDMMNYIFCLIMMQISYTVTNTFEKMTLKCRIGGIVLHYFWLSMCCCLFICCFCMWKSFRGLGSRNKSGKGMETFIYFLLFAYIPPLVVVAGNVTVVYLLYGYVGYGNKVCFVDCKISNIVTFILPLSLVCLGNTLLFIQTILNIRVDKTIQKSTKDTSELIILVKLFTLTRSIWILQIIDGLIPEISIYSFVATILSSSQGLFIFLSFATSPRIINHIKSWRNIGRLGKDNS